MSKTSILDKSRSVAKPGFNRWLIPPVALLVHMSIGQIYSLSVFKTSFTHHFNASHTAVGWVFSVGIAMLGTSSAIFGKWMERNGPRKAMTLACLCWCSGFLIGAVGIHLGQLWLVYLGYGFIGGIGLGIGYISPVSTLMKWFPERPGLATGLAIMGFGGGALFAAPFATLLLQVYDPFFEPTTEGAYASGQALVATFCTLAGIYAVMMLLAAALIRIPPGFENDETSRHFPGKNGALVRTSMAVRTPQFYLLWLMLFCNITAGIGILESAAPMVQDYFRAEGVSPVTAGMAAGFVGLLSLGNMTGRFIWSSASDAYGRKIAYLIYLGGGMVIYMLLVWVGHTSVGLFVALVFLLLTFYGGGFATIPAYLKDMFGTLEVGAIHGRVLTAWSAAGVAGPLIINCALDQAGSATELYAADYRPALVMLMGILGIGLLANLLVKPVSAKYHDQEKAQEIAKEGTRNHAAH